MVRGCLLQFGDENAQLGLARSFDNPVMLHFASTMLNNTWLEQVYYIYLTLHFIS